MEVILICANCAILLSIWRAIMQALRSTHQKSFAAMLITNWQTQSWTSWEQPVLLCQAGFISIWTPRKGADQSLYLFFTSSFKTYSLRPFQSLLFCFWITNIYQYNPDKALIITSPTAMPFCFLPPVDLSNTHSMPPCSSFWNKWSLIRNQEHWHAPGDGEAWQWTGCHKAQAAWLKGAFCQWPQTSKF